MRYLFYICIFIISTKLYSQSFKQYEFNKLNNEIRSELHNLKTNKDFYALLKKINLSEESIKQVEDLIQSKGSENNPNFNIQDFLLLFYQKSTEKDKIILTLYAYKALNDRAGEDLSEYGYGEYYFIIESLISLDKNIDAFFEQSKVITNQNEIEQWYLYYHNEYYRITVKFNEKYSFIPPLPPPIPSSLNNSPYHLHKTANQYMTNQQWVKANLMYDKLIEYYPNDARLYFERGYNKYNAFNFTEAIRDFSKSIELNPDFLDPYRFRSLAYYYINEYQKALNDINKAINLDSKNPILYSKRAYIYNKLYLIKNACEDINESIRLGILKTIPESKKDIREFQNFCNEQE